MFLFCVELFSASSFALISELFLANVDRSRGTFCITRYICIYISRALPSPVRRFCARSSRNVILWLLSRCDDFSHSLWKTFVTLFGFLEVPLYEKRWKYILREYVRARMWDECVPSFKGLPDSECVKIGCLLRWWIQRGRTEKTKGEKRFIYIMTYIFNFRETRRQVTFIFFLSLITLLNSIIEIFLLTVKIGWAIFLEKLSV